MSSSPPSLEPTIAAPSLADVLERIPQMPVSPQARQNMASAVRAFGKVLDRNPRHIPIHAPTYRKLIAAASPGAVEMSASRWRNVRSDTNRAIRLSGLSVETEATRVPLTAEWETLAMNLDTKTDWSVMARFGRFCSAHQCCPGQVRAETVEEYLRDLQQIQLARNPDVSVRAVVRIWNRKIAGVVLPADRRLPPRATAQSYGPSWDDLPPAFASNAEDFRRTSAAPPAFDAEELRRPVTEVTATQRHRMIRRVAAAEVLSGIDPLELQSLADLVSPDRLKRALQFFLDRNGGKPSVQAFEMAQLCLCIARHWARLPEEQIALIAQWVAKLRPPNSGMTEKNRHRLRQFTSGEVVRRVLCLPDHLLSEARKLPVGTTSALMVQNAVAIAILTTAPIRVGNLCRLDREVHFRRAFSVGDRRHHLVIPAREVKNNVYLEFPVPDRVMTLIDHYMCTYQPLIGDGRPSSLLFPGRISDRPKELSGLRNSVSAVILRETGLHMNAHLFRHFAAYLFLKANPGQYEAVRQLLGHRRIETTINFYASFETDAAMHQFNQVIDGYREAS